jgi:hypothetical protein
MEISIGSYKFRLEILVAIVIVSWIMFGHILCSCCRVNLLETMVNIRGEVTNGPTGKKAAANNRVTTEGFTGANKTNTGPEFSGADSPGYIMNPSKWSMPTLTYSPGTKPDAGVQSIWDRPKQPVPLPEGQLDLFATTEFKPECCPNAYSNSMGCACMTMQQYNWLKSRSGNNVPYSEY